MPRESRMHILSSAVRGRGTPSLALWWVVASVFVVSCGDDPVENTPVPCNGDCLVPIEVCDTVTNTCVLANNTGDADMGPDSDASPDTVTDDLSLSDTSDDADDMTSDPDVAEDADSTGDADTDVSEDAGDGRDDSDAGEEVDAAGDPDIEIDPDVVPDDGGGDEGDVGDGICPLDFLETETSNNFFESASLLHTDNLLVGESACGDLAFDDRGDLSECVDEDNCLCTEVVELGACQIEDPDFLRFSFLAGDSAWVRVVFEDDVAKTDLDFNLFKPTGITVCESSATCIGAEVCLGGRCQRSLPGEWVSTSDGPVYEFNVGAAAPGEGQTTVVLDYVLKVKAHDFDIHYDVLVQVAPNSRDCTADPWDAPWVSYDAASGSEVECTEESCTQEVGELADNPTTVGHLCPWDRQDVIRHQISETDQARFFQVQWLDSLADLSASLYLKRGESLEWVTDFVAGGAANTLIAERSDMDRGTYQIVVSGSQTTEFSVSVFNTD